MNSKLKEILTIQSVSLVSIVFSFLLMRVILLNQNEVFYVRWTVLLKSVMLLPVLLEFKLKEVVYKNNSSGALSIFLVAVSLIALTSSEFKTVFDILGLLMLCLCVVIYRFFYETYVLASKAHHFAYIQLFRQGLMILLFWKFEIEVEKAVLIFTVLYALELLFYWRNSEIDRIGIKFDKLWFVKANDIELILVPLFGVIFQLLYLKQISLEVNSVLFLLFVQISMLYSQFGNAINQYTYKYGTRPFLVISFQIGLGLLLFVSFYCFGDKFIEVLFGQTFSADLVKYYSFLVIYYMIRFLYNNIIFSELRLQAGNARVWTLPLTELLVFSLCVWTHLDLMMGLFASVGIALVVYLSYKIWVRN